MAAETTVGVLGMVAAGAAALGIFWVNLKNKSNQTTITNYKELAESWESRFKVVNEELAEYKKLHIESVKAISDLQGQLKTLKDIPLKQIQQQNQQILTTVLALIEQGPPEVKNTIVTERRTNSRTRKED